MKQFFFELVRGVIVGLLVGYLIRPEAEIFTKIESAFDDGGEIVEHGFFELLINYFPEYIVIDYQPDILLAGGTIGAFFGIIFWFYRRRKSGVASRTVKKRITTKTKKTS